MQSMKETLQDIPVSPSKYAFLSPCMSQPLKGDCPHLTCGYPMKTEQ